MNIFKRILFALMLVSISAQSYGFTDGTVLTASQLNSAFANAAITGGTISGASVAATTLSATIANPSINYRSPAAGSVARSYQSKFGDTVSVLDFAGCDPTGVADSTTCLQNAINAEQGTGTKLLIPPGLYKTTATLTASAPIFITGVGAGWVGTPGTISAASVKGSVLYFAHLGAGLQFTGTASLGESHLENIGTIRNQPAPGAGWSPIAADYDLVSATTDTYLKNIFLINPTKGLMIVAGRTNVDGFRAQAFVNTIQVDTAYDTVIFNNVHQWPFWDSSTTTKDYTQANLTFMRLYRVDNPMLSNIFSIQHKYGFLFSQSAAGATSKIRATNVDLDEGGNSIYVDTSVTNGVTGQFSNLTAQGVTSPVGSAGVDIEGNNSTIDFTNLSIVNSSTNGIRVYGTGNTTRVKNLTINTYNSGGGGFAAVEAGAGNTINVGGSPIIANGNTAASYGGAGTINIEPTIATSGKLTVTTSGSNSGLEVDDLGASGANIKLNGNGATTPAKYLRVNGGSLQVVNNGYSGVIFNLDDSGNLGNIANISATGQVTSNSKNVLTVTDTQAGAAGVSLTVGASPYAYTATYGGSVAISGGTVSEVTLTRSSVVVWSSSTGTNVIPVRAGDIVTVTYSAAPNMYQLSD